MSEGYASLDAHAYVDNSLSPADRAGFEAALRRDAKLRARVEAWEAQNEAIRLAFGAAPRPRHAPPPEPARPSNENTSARPLRAHPSRSVRQVAPVRRGAARPGARRTRARGWRCRRRGLRRRLIALARRPRDPRARSWRAPADLARRRRLRRCGSISSPTIRARSPPGSRPDFARLNAARLAPSGWSLLGVRVVPGVESAAAMVLYEDAIGGRAALLLEPTDGLPTLPAICERNADETVVAGAAQGYAYAVAGPTRSGAAALAATAAGD